MAMGIIGAAAFVLGSPQWAHADPIIATDFVSNGNFQVLNGTQTGLTTDVPNGDWDMNGPFISGYYPAGSPAINANWNGSPQNAVTLIQSTVVGIPIATTGSYTEPTDLTISSEMTDFPGYAPGGLLGFWSSLPGTGAANGFTGLSIQTTTGNTSGDYTLQVYQDGAAAGSAVDVGADTGSPNTIGYNIDTTTGIMSDVTFNGTPVLGLELLGFSSSTADYGYAGVAASDGHSQGTAFSSLDVSGLAVGVPEPAALGLVGLAISGLTLRRKRHG
jgi:hypothetical protein